MQHVHGEGQVSLGLGGQHARRSEARVIDESDVVLAHPLRRIGRVRDDRVERLIVPVGRFRQGVPQSDVKVREVDVVQEHVDAAQVVRRQVDLLAEILTATRRPEKLRELQQQRPRARARVVHARHVGAPIQGEGRENLCDLLGRVELAARLARARGIHGHQVLVGITEGIDLRSTVFQR